jgi:integrase
LSTELRPVELLKSVAEKLGVHPLALGVDLVVPTVKEYLPEVIAAATPAMKRSYMSYWKRAETFFGELRLHEIRATKIEAFRQDVIANAKKREGHCHGRYAGSQALSAMRKLYRFAVADGLIGEADDPAKKVRIARRLHSTRRALTPAEVADINQAMLLSSRDHELDGLILRLHIETACRRGGALALRLRDVDKRYSRILLREKFGSQRWQPISPTLCAALLAHARSRGAKAREDALLRRANGRALTYRHYDTLWAGIRRVLPWAEQLGVSAHWLRHTTLSWVERRYSYAIARVSLTPFAGHVGCVSRRHGETACVVSRTRWG